MSNTSEFRALSGREFLKLSREEAAAHLMEVRRHNLWPDSDRLQGVWWDHHMESLNAFMPGAESALSSSISPAASESGMLSGGRVLTAIGIVGAFVCAFVGLNGFGNGDVASIGWMVTAHFLATLGGLGVLFWVAGALEQRLIEIKAAISAGREVG